MPIFIHQQIGRKRERQRERESVGEREKDIERLVEREKEEEKERVGGDSHGIDLAVLEVNPTEITISVHTLHI